MASHSALEGLPLELLEKIFIGSENCDLPLCSRSLQHLLSAPRLIPLMARAILSSDNGAAQSKLLSRRLFTPALFDSITLEITPPCTDSPYLCSNNFRFWAFPSPPSPPHFVFAKGARICPRLLCGKRADMSLAQYRASAGASLKLLVRLLAGGVECNLAAGPLHTAAIQALQDALDARLPNVVAAFTNERGFPRCNVPAGVLKAALMSPKHNFHTLGHLIRCVTFTRFRLREEHAVVHDAELRAWVAKRVRDDRWARRVGMREGRAGTALQMRWKGDWLEGILYRNEQNLNYLRFAVIRKQSVTLHLMDESDESMPPRVEE
ncbi:MAG: hypothetical protein M1829_002637 [Trizodia sp. TS-e1964]|nr:MAG: hypothetical protein M1829_002637 [Trizodia sp. TS-e1964]